MDEPYIMKLSPDHMSSFDQLMELRDWCAKNISPAVPNINDYSSFQSRLEYQGWCFIFDTNDNCWYLHLKDQRYASIISLL